MSLRMGRNTTFLTLEIFSGVDEVGYKLAKKCDRCETEVLLVLEVHL